MSKKWGSCWDAPHDTFSGWLTGETCRGGSSWGGFVGGTWRRLNDGSREDANGYAVGEDNRK